MSYTVNKVILLGRLTRNPELKYTKNDKAIVKFSIATNREWTSKNGEKHEIPEYHNVVAWNKLADSCRDRIFKGSAVLVDGELQSRTFKTDDGKNRTIVEIKAKRVQFLNKLNKPEGDDYTSSNDDDDSSYEDNSFDKFLSDEESDLMNDDK